MISVLLGIFASLALILAAIGIYGVIAYSVAQRTREIGVRMAVGSTRGRILLLVLREAAGFYEHWSSGRNGRRVSGLIFADALLFQTSSADPFSIVISVFSLLMIAMLAAVLPASRAATINPIEALRSE